MKKFLKVLVIISLTIMLVFVSNITLANEIVQLNQNELLNENTIEMENEEEFNNEINTIDENKQEENNFVEENKNYEIEEKTEIIDEKDAVIESDNQTIINGTYNIVPYIANWQALDITDGSKEDGAQIQLWDYLGAQQQKFNIEYLKEGYYKITSDYTGKALTIDGNNLVQKEYMGLDNQKWIIRENDNSNYSIISFEQDLAIELKNGIYGNGIKLSVAPVNNSNSQKFNFTFRRKLNTSNSLKNGIYRINAIINAKPAFDITNGSYLDGAQIQLWDYLEAEQQKFEITFQKDGYYRIRSAYTGKVLAVSDSKVTNGTTIIQKTEEGLDSEKWIIQDEGNGEYSINSKINNLCIDIPDWDAVNGKKLLMHDWNGGTAQRFTFSDVSENINTVSTGIYNIVPASSEGMALDITDGSTENGIQLQIWDYLGAEQQKFELRYIQDGGYYKIFSEYTGKLLTISDENKLVQQDDMDLNTQKWIIKNKGNNRYVIVSYSQNLAIQLTNGAWNGSKLDVASENGSISQQFIFNGRRKLTPGKSLKNGIYKITSILNNKPAFDITDGSKEDGAQIQLWDYLNASQQKFEIKYNEGDGYYTIKSLYTEKVLAVSDSKVTNGTTIIQKTEEGLDSEKWIIQDEGNGEYSINSKLNNLCIDTPDWDAVNGKKLVMHDWNGGTAQKYNFIEVGNYKTIEDGTYRIAMFANDIMSFDIDCGSRNNGANLQLWDWQGSGTIQQQFNFVYNSFNGTYTIYNLNSGKVLDVANGGLTNYTNVWQYESNGTAAQEWVIIQNDNGSYSIVSALNGLYLDVENGQLINGANVQLYEGNGTAAQQFKLIQQSTKATRFLEDGIYRIASKYDNNMGFDITDGSKENGAQIQLWYYLNSAQEEFNITYEDGYYYLGSNYSNKVIQAGNENEIITQQEKNPNNDSQKWILQPNNGSYNIISKATGLYIDVIDGNFVDGNKIQTHYGNGNIAQLFDFIDVAIAIDENKYPGIKERVNELKRQHPNWQFEVLYTGLDFYTAVQGEYEHYTVDNSGKRQYANLVDTNVYKGAWIAPNPVVTGNWAQASYNGIAYFMDPRNFLNDTDAFQFVDLSDYYNSGATLESIQYQVNGTFLNNFAEDVRVSCEHQNVNPYYILARLFQEQGKNGAATIYMDGGDGKQYFNPFNIGAVNGNDVATALAKAKEQGWDSMQKGIEGGISFIRQNYLDANQNTLYLNKFDVNPNSPGGFYTHQYMQNLSAAYSEARTFRSAYVDTGTLDNTIRFIIPVYENMPTEPAAKPSEQGGVLVTDQGPKSVQIINIDTSLIVRDGPGTQYPEIERLQNGTTMLSVERYDNGWQKVITPSGTIGYCSGDYLQFISDITNCNERVAIQTNSEVNVRIGPGTSFSSLGMFTDGTTGTRILKGAYNANGYTWDLVIFDNGVKGFVATNYLRLI